MARRLMNRRKAVTWCRLTFDLRDFSNEISNKKESRSFVFYTADNLDSSITFKVKKQMVPSKKGILKIEDTLS